MALQDNFQYSKVLEITQKILEKPQWEKKIQNSEIVNKYLEEYLNQRRAKEFVHPSHGGYFNWHSEVEATFWIAINTLRELPNEAKALTRKYVFPPPNNSPKISPQSIKEITTQLKSKTIRGENMLVPVAPLVEDAKLGDLDWLIQESITNPNFWGEEDLNPYDHMFCSICQQEFTGCIYTNYEFTNSFEETVYVMIGPEVYCENCYTSEPARPSIQMRFSKYLADFMMTETRKNIQLRRIPLNEHDIICTDNLISGELYTLFIKEMNVLSALSHSDIHPGTGGKVMNLIHPSLFPFIIGESKPVHDNDPVVQNCMANYISRFGYMRRFSAYQWLPAEVSVDKEGICEFMSYVNNLYPDLYPNLYPILGLILSHILPLFEQCLKRSLKDRTLQVIVKASDYILKPGETYQGNWHLEGTPQENIVASAIYYYEISDGIIDDGLAFRRQRNDDLDWPQTRDMRLEWEENIFGQCLLKLNQIEPPAGKSLTEVYFQYDEVCNWMGLSTIPEPTLDIETVPLGHIEPKQGRCTVFSNSIQHKISGIHASPTATEPQKRRILCFFLVDPDKPIPSSKSILPQQKEYVQHKLYSVLQDIEIGGHPIPVEICEQIAHHATHGFTLKQALEHRLKFMYDRRILIKDANTDYEQECSL